MMIPCHDMVRAGDSEGVLDELRDPKVMGVVWAGVWSEASLALAEGVARDRSAVGRKVTLLAHLPPSSPLRSDPDFRGDVERLKRVFTALGVSLIGEQELGDAARIEPAAHFDLAPAGKWHVDSLPLLMLSAPGGKGTEFLARRPRGGFTDADRTVFVPHDHKAVEAEAVTLPRNAALFFKGAMFDQSSGTTCGLIHRRPNRQLETDYGQGRVLMHYSW